MTARWFVVLTVFVASLIAAIYFRIAQQLPSFLQTNSELLKNMSTALNIVSGIIGLWMLIAKWANKKDTTKDATNAGSRISGNVIRGNKNTLKAHNKSSVDKNKIKGDDNKIEAS